MKFNIIKNKLIIMLMIGLSLGAGMLTAMEPERTNSVTPYVHAAASLAVARYLPEIVEPLMPRIAPNYPLAQALVPPAIRYGAYGLTAHFVAKNGLGIQYKDLLKAESLKKGALKAAKAAPNFAPALICHPQIAQVAADYCSHFASSYLNDAQLQTLDKYAPIALMTAGAVGTAYLVNKNIFNNRFLEKAKRVWKDIRPYSFIAPALVSYNADSVKEYVMPHLSATLGKNLSADIGSGVKAGVYWGGMGLAVYLFATQTLDLANQSYVKNKIQKILELCKITGTQIDAAKEIIASAQSDAAAAREGQTVQNGKLIEFYLQTEEATKKITRLLQQMAATNTVAEAAVKTLEINNANLIKKAKDIGIITAEIAQNIQILRVEHEKNIAQILNEFKDLGEHVLVIIAQKDKEVEAQFDELEKQCIAQAQTLTTNIQPKLEELLKLLHKQGQTYHITEEMINNMANTLATMTDTVDQMTQNLRTMHADLKPAARNNA